MTKTEILMADLEEASRIAKAGEEAPLLGGNIGLMWGILITLIFSYQYLILSGRLSVPEITLAFAWIAFGVVGGTGSMLLGRKIDKQPGANSVGNRVEGYVWTMFAGSMAALVVGVFLNIILKNGDQTVWNTVLVFAFAGQGIAYGVMAKVTKSRLLHITSFASMSFAAMSFMVINQVEVYLLGALGAALTIILPNLLLKAKA